LDDLIYQRQQNLDIHQPDEVCIVGCGGVGAWVAIDLAMVGARKLKLFDDDTVEIHNINRVPFRPEDAGRRKTAVLKGFIKRIRPETAVYQYGKITNITQPLLSNCVVDCTDKVDTQKSIYTYCKTRSIPYYRLGYDGFHMTVSDGFHPKTPDVSKVWDDNSGTTGYTIIDSWVVTPQIAAAFVTHMICRPGTRGHISVDTNTLMLINDYIGEKQDGRKKR